MDIVLFLCLVIGGGDVVGVGFGLGFVVIIDLVCILLLGSWGDFFWGGVVGSYFWVDFVEDFVVVFMI